MASTCLPHLPDELFIQVLQSVDDPFVLWVTCRQVSQAWRKEAERAFRATFLPILHIEWTHIQFGRIEKNLIATTDAHSIDPQSSTLSLLLRPGQPRPEELSTLWQDTASCGKLEHDAKWIQAYGDVAMWTAGYGFEELVQAIWFDAPDGRYTFVGGAETRAFDLKFPALEQDGRFSCRVTCDWKALMNALFMEERYVRRHQDPGPSFYEIAEEGIRANLVKAEHGMITRTTTPDPDPWEKAIAYEKELYEVELRRLLGTHCHRNEDYKTLYAAAFQQRLRLAFSREGKDLYNDVFDHGCDANTPLSFNLEKTGCRWMMQCRLDRLYAFAKGIWERKFGKLAGSSYQIVAGQV